MTATEINGKRADDSQSLYEFQNLGRSTAREAKTTVQFEKDAYKADKLTLSLGPVPTDRPRHFAVCYKPDLLPLVIQFSKMAEVRYADTTKEVALEARGLRWRMGKPVAKAGQLPIKFGP